MPQAQAQEAARGGVRQEGGQKPHLQAKTGSEPEPDKEALSAAYSSPCLAARRNNFITSLLFDVHTKKQPPLTPIVGAPRVQ